MIHSSNKQPSGQKRDCGLFSEADSMDNMTDSESPPPLGPTGIDHWEEQRRKWTRGFAERVDIKKEDDPFLDRLKDATNDGLVRCYHQITEAGKPFRRKIPLSQLIPILVAGWKDVGLWPNEEALRREILQKRLNPDDYNLQVHLSSILDSDASSDKMVNIAVSKVLARQNQARLNHARLLEI